MRLRVAAAMVGFAVIGGLVFALSGMASSDVQNQTTLTEDADSAQTWICVEDGSAFTEGVTICIDSDADTSCENTGDPEEEEKVVGVTPGGYCREGDEVPLTTRLDQVHLIGALVHTMPCAEITPSPTPTPTPTPPPAEFICTPPPTSRTFELQMGWNNLVWTGASGADPTKALSGIEGNYDIS